VLAISGGRFKKEVVLDGQSYLLLIRDEGGLPEMQVMALFFTRIIFRVATGLENRFCNTSELSL